MKKSKYGVSVALLGAAGYFLLYFGGYTAFLLLAGYAFIIDDNEWLKKTLVTAGVLAISLSVLSTVISLIPDALSWINTCASVFNGYFDYSNASSFFNVFTKAIAIIRTVLFILLGINALKFKTIKLPFVDKFVEKYM